MSFPNGNAPGYVVVHQDLSWSVATYFTDIRQLRIDGLANEECVFRPATAPFEIAGHQGHQFVVEYTVTRTTNKFHLKLLSPGDLMIKTTVGLDTGHRRQVNMFRLRLDGDGNDTHKIFVCRKGQSSIILNFKLELFVVRITDSGPFITLM